VEKGDADAAFVAVSEVRRTPLSWIEVPPRLYVPIREEAVVLARSPNRAAARRFVDFLRSPESRAILIVDGYGVP
jgi:molybdate transport system substrate-binding protein